MLCESCRAFPPVRKSDLCGACLVARVARIESECGERVSRLEAGLRAAETLPGALERALVRVADLVTTLRDVRMALVPAVSEPTWPHHRLADSFVRRLCAVLDASPSVGN